MLRRATSRLAIIAAMLGGTALPARAETLQEALAAAYRDNPTLTAARAGQRAGRPPAARGRLIHRLGADCGRGPSLRNGPRPPQSVA